MGPGLQGEMEAGGGGGGGLGGREMQGETPGGGA